MPQDGAHARITEASEMSVIDAKCLKMSEAIQEDLYCL
jgi:hypothetical protein